MRRTLGFALFGLSLALFAATWAYAAPARHHRHKAGAHASASGRKAGAARRKHTRTAAHTPAAEPCIAPPPPAKQRTAKPRTDKPPETAPETTDQASSAQAPPAKTRNAKERRQPVPPPLRGSYASLVRQNEKTEDEGLDRIENNADLESMIRHRRLVPLPASTALKVNQGLPEDRRYCRPWTASFLADMSRAHQTRFHRPLEVNSAVRTVEVQKRLERTNGNAAPAEGEVASPHLTGAAVDIGKQGMTREELGWTRSWLLPLQKAGKLDVEEEFHQACFHITVYKSYAPPRPVIPAAPAVGHRKSSATQPAPESAPHPSLPSAGDTASGAE